MNRYKIYIRNSIPEPLHTFFYIRKELDMFVAYMSKNHINPSVVLTVATLIYDECDWISMVAHYDINLKNAIYEDITWNGLKSDWNQFLDDWNSL